MKSFSAGEVFRVSRGEASKYGVLQGNPRRGRSVSISEMEAEEKMGLEFEISIRICVYAVVCVRVARIESQVWY